MFKLIVDNSDKFYDSFSGQYLDESEMGFDFYLLDNETGEAIACFPSLKEAEIYQMGLGLRAESHIESIFGVEN